MSFSRAAVQRYNKYSNPPNNFPPRCSAFRPSAVTIIGPHGRPMPLRTTTKSYSQIGKDFQLSGNPISPSDSRLCLLSRRWYNCPLKLFPGLIMSAKYLIADNNTKILFCLICIICSRGMNWLIVSRGSIICTGYRLFHILLWWAQ